MSEPTTGRYEHWPEPQVSVGSRTEGYPCPKDGTDLTLLDGGAWCPTCHTVWREIAETPVPDTDRAARPRWRVSFAWYDLWVGVFWDRRNRVLYICPLPCVLLEWHR